MSKKKVLRLKESEMVELIERIVNEVKREKRQQIKESLAKKRPTNRRRK